MDRCSPNTERLSIWAIYPQCTTSSTIYSIAPVLQEFDTTIRPSSAVAAVLHVEDGPGYARHLCIRDLHAQHVAIASGDSSIAVDDPVIRFLGCAGCNTLETLQRALNLPSRRLYSYYQL